jgi:hypothetical protein
MLAALFLLAGLMAREGAAQSFGPPLLGEVLFRLLDREGHPRWTLSAYYAGWENPFSIQTLKYSPRCREELPIRRQVRIAAPASPLLEASYALSARWSLGAWYNPVSGDRIVLSGPTGCERFPRESYSLDLDLDTEIADFHAIYQGPRGLLAQVGYYREHKTFRDPARTVDAGSATLVSWNVWLTQRLDVPVGCTLVTPFVSTGYHPSSALNHAVSVMTGLAVTLGDRFSLSGSVWWFDLANAATRVTGGLVWRF